MKIDNDMDCLGEDINNKNTNIYAHVGRMPEDRILSKIMKNRPEGKRSRGRPKKRCTTIWYKQTLRSIKEEEEEEDKYLHKIF